MKSILLFSLFFSSVHVLNVQGYDSSGVLKAIQKLGVALSKPDPRILVDLFLDNGDFTNVIDSTIHGRENIYDAKKKQP